MQQRLKVNDFYQPINLTQAIEIDNLDQAFFVLDWLFVTTKDAPIILQQYSLKTKAKEKDINLPFEGIKGIEMVGSLICFYFSNNEDLWICWGQKVVPLKSHFLPITAIVAHRGNIYTGSADMTIRIWNPLKQTLIQDPKLHALSAHTGNIITFLNTEDFLFSSSADKSVIVWRGTKIYSKKVFNTEVIMLAECSQSGQFAFYEQSGTISIIDSRLLAKEKRIEVIRTIDERIDWPIIGLEQIDDSFLQLVLASEMKIAQINLGNVIASINLGEKVQVIGSRCLRRMTLLAIRMRGLFTVKF